MKFSNLLECIHSFCPSFVPNETNNYTLRFIFYRKGDLENGVRNACFSVTTGLWSLLESTFERINSDPDISSCLVEYVCEYDSSFCGMVFCVKEIEKNNEEEN